MTNLRKIKGQWAENLAEQYLQARGLQTLTRNYRCKEGEIDLVMQHDNIVIFVEVRYRSSQKYGGSLESIDHRKQHRIFITAQYYLQSLENFENFTYRFDVVLIKGTIEKPHYQWMKDAFRPET